MENRKHVRRLILLAIFVSTTLAFVSGCQANQWVYFHDEEIRGYVVEADTKKPIEGAIVVSIWRLSQIFSHGFGGYAKVIEIKTDKEGKFTIPAWKSFKPLTADSVMYGLAPEIVIYKPGYKVHWSHKLMRAGFPDDYSMTTDEKNKAKEEYSINPAKLVKIHDDKDKLRNIDDVELALSIGSLYALGIKLDIMTILKEDKMFLKGNNIQRRRITY